MSKCKICGKEMIKINDNVEYCYDCAIGGVVMEEKDRFEYIHNDDIGDGLLDIKNNKEIYDIGQISTLLNQQDKHIKKLEETLEKARQREVIIHQNYRQGYIKDLEEINELQEEIQQLKQSQKQLAIEKLEKVKNYFDDSNDEDYDKSEGWIITNRSIIEYVDNQIKELKEGKPTIKCSLCGREMVKLADGVNYCCNHCHIQTLLNVSDIGEKL